MRPFRPASLSVADPTMLRLLLPPVEPVVSEEDRLRAENNNLRAMVTALLDQLVAADVNAARNWAEHPRTDAELADIADASRRRHERHALAAIPAKER